MLKKINASAWGDRLQSLRPSKQMLLAGLRQSLIVPIVLVGVYVVFPLLQDGVPLSPQQRVEPLEQRINDLDKQIKASKTPSTADLKEIATLEKGRIDSENTIRTSLFQAVGGLLVFVTLYISWRTLQANEAKQVAERFSKAVEQLGNDNIHVRLGGIYALEQIAKDAEEKYYWQVMETLTSYVRLRSLYPPKATKTHSSFVQAAIKPSQTSERQPNEDIPPLPDDIQAVMTVLARRKHSYGHPLERYPLDLHGADLRRLQLPPKTQLNQVNFAGANFTGTNLQKASLQKVQLHEANLQEADLEKADLAEANLKEAYLWKANLKKADFRETDLRTAWLAEAELQLANLVKAKLQEANLSESKLQGARLWKAELQGAILWNANLREVKFRDFINLYSLEATGKTTNAMGLTWEQLDAAASYEGAILPSYLPPRSQQPYID
jgi:uncharacterized protein YjbI with pentapeptide repeats